METFILTWNPDRWPWPEDEYEEAVQSTASGGTEVGRWSVGIRKHGISIGDRAYLLRQSHERGIVASGQFVSEIYEDSHWDGSGRETTYADVEWTSIIDPEDRLPVEVLISEVPDVTWDRMQGSGVKVPPDAAVRLEELWAEYSDDGLFRSPEELPPDEEFPEGSVTRAEVNRYERDPRARAACLDHWGCRCSVCDLDFEERYGTLGGGFIHVHHLKELSTVGAGYHVDPVKDLRPVCPNCHAMLHRQRPALTIKKLKATLATSA